MEIQQSKPYANFIRSLGWQVVIHNKQYYFLKRFPFIGALLKVQRVTTLPNMSAFTRILTQERITRLVIEPDMRIHTDDLNRWITKLPKHISVSRDPYLPTKTIRINLIPSEETIFRNFSEAKRRAVRRAQKNNIRIDPTLNIPGLIQIKNASAGFLGFITTHGLDKIWMQFAPSMADTLLAYSPDNQIIGGILLLYWKKLAYYWVAGATKKGKHLVAPTLLVWEAIKQSKAQGCTSFDFVGVWDERDPKHNHEWKGFTKFKEGFGGSQLYYPVSYL